MSTSYYFSLQDPRSGALWNPAKNVYGRLLRVRARFQSNADETDLKQRDTDGNLPRISPGIFLCKKLHLIFLPDIKNPRSAWFEVLRHWNLKTFQRILLLHIHSRILQESYRYAVCTWYNIRDAHEIACETMSRSPPEFVPSSKISRCTSSRMGCCRTRRHDGDSRFIRFAFANRRVSCTVLECFGW